MRLAEEISENSSHGEYDDRPEAGVIMKAAPHYFWGIWDVVTERVPKLDFETAREELAALPFKATLEAAGWESRRSRDRRLTARSALVKLAGPERVEPGARRPRSAGQLAHRLLSRLATLGTDTRGGLLAALGVGADTLDAVLERLHSRGLARQRTSGRAADGTWAVTAEGAAWLASRARVRARGGFTPAPELDARRCSPAHSPVARKARRKERVRSLFRKALAASSPERVALDTARAALRAQGPGSRLALSLLDTPANETRPGVLTAVLAAGGVAALTLTPEGRRAVGRRLFAALADPANAIHVPEGSRLAARLAAYESAVAEEAQARVPALA